MDNVFVENTKMILKCWQNMKSMTWKIFRENDYQYVSAINLLIATKLWDFSLTQLLQKFRESNHFTK